MKLSPRTYVARHIGHNAKVQRTLRKTRASRLATKTETIVAQLSHRPWRSKCLRDKHRPAAVKYEDLLITVLESRMTLSALMVPASGT